jgi:hypothetical protein
VQEIEYRKIPLKRPLELLDNFLSDYRKYLIILINQIEASFKYREIGTLSNIIHFLNLPPLKIFAISSVERDVSFCEFF